MGTMFSAAVFSFLVAGAMSLITSGRNMVAAGVERSDLEERARAVCAKVAKELLGGRMTADPAGGPRLTMRRNRQGIDPVTGEVNWTLEGPLTYDFVYSPGETDDGTDEDGNGLVDDGQIVRTENGVATVIATGVPEQGLAFTRRGDRIRIDLTLAGRDGQGRLVRATASRFVYPRN